MAKRLMKSVLLIAGITLLLAGCKAQDECSGGSCLDENLDINPAGVMAEEDSNFVSVQVFEDHLVFLGKGPADQFDYKAGDILISSKSMPGFIRHVLALEPDGNVLVVRTLKAGVADLFRGKISRHVDLSQGWDRPVITDGRGHVLLRPYKEYATQRLPLTFNIDGQGVDISGEVSFDTDTKSLVFKNLKITRSITCSGGDCSGGFCNDDSDCATGFSCVGDPNQANGRMEGACEKGGSGVTGSISLVLDGSLTPRLDADFDLNVGWEWFHPVIEQFKVYFSGGMTMDFQKIGLEAGFKEVLAKEIKIGSVPIATPIPIGPFVIPAGIKFTFYLGTSNSLELSGDMTTKLLLDGDLTVGAEYTGGAWKKIDQPTQFTAGTEPFQGTANGKIKLSVYVKPEMMFEFIQGTDVGPALSLTPALNLEYNFLPERCLEFFFDLMLSFEIKADALLSWCPPNWMNGGAGQAVAEKVCGGLEKVVDKIGAFSLDKELYKKVFYSNCKDKVCKKDKVSGDSSEDVYFWDKTKHQLVPDEEFGLYTRCDQEIPPAVCCGGECVELCGKGNLQGLVVDRADENIRIQGAHVVLTNSDGDTVYDGVTGADGVYQVNDLYAGHYTLMIDADGYYPYSASVQIRSNETENMAKLVAIPEDCSMDGTISGKVTDATTNASIAGAEIRVKTMADDTLVATTTTDQAGNYKTDPLPVNYYKVIVSFADYASSETENVSVCGYDDDDPGNDDVVVNFSIAPVEGFYHIVLRWGDSPKDLDIHAKLPSGEHLFYRGGCRGDRNAAPWAEVDYDMRLGYGPETITITQPQQGTYEFFVHNYGDQNDDDDSGSLSSSGAQLEVSDESGNTIRTFDVPGSCSAYFWYAFNLNFDANGNATIEVTNNCSSGSNPADYEDPPICDLP